MKKKPTNKTQDRRAGGVNMEYVILAVLIAAAVVVAVVVFSRSVAGMFIVAGESATLRENTAKQTLDTQRQRRNADAAVAKDYHDVMHE
jgi:Flp pilus assembly pilin Flp